MNVREGELKDDEKDLAPNSSTRIVRVKPDG